MNVWTYCECPYCKSIVHGKYRSCGNCGSAIPNNVHYLMPDNPRVKSAIANNEVVMKEYEKNIDEKGNIGEIVPESEIREEPNWVCEFCGYQNFDDTEYCTGCGAPKSDKDYFDIHIDIPRPNSFSKNKDSEDDISVTTTDFEDNKEEVKKIPIYKKKNHYEKASKTYRDQKKYNNEYNEKIYSSSSYKPKVVKDKREIFDRYQKKPLIIGVALLLILFLVWLFFPVIRQAVVEDFGWNRSINVEEYTLCHESDWSVPAGGKIISQTQEVHHYDQVLDHYETRTRQVSYQVLDGYTTTYQDLGNGQARTIQTPKYRTEYRTETYQDPIYKSVPVLKTKYYYDIGRWKYYAVLETNGFGNKKPYWYETDLPKDISNPNYGDKKQSVRNEVYYATVRDEEGNIQKKEYSYSEWMNLNKGDIIEYKSFRFSHKPL